MRNERALNRWMKQHHRDELRVQIALPAIGAIATRSRAVSVFGVQSKHAPVRSPAMAQVHSQAGGCFLVLARVTRSGLREVSRGVYRASFPRQPRLQGRRAMGDRSIPGLDARARSESMRRRHRRRHRRALLRRGSRPRVRSPAGDSSQGTPPEEQRDHAAGARAGEVA